jgi:hypothetical protein
MKPLLLDVMSCATNESYWGAGLPVNNAAQETRVNSFS